MIKSKEILLLLLFLNSFGSSTKAQEEQLNNKAKYAVYGNYPMFYNGSHILKGEAVFQIAFERKWHSTKYTNWHYSVSLLFGSYFNHNSPVSSNIRYEPHIGLDFSTCYGSKKHFFELGVGIDYRAITKLIIGYRLELKKHFLMKLQLMPSTRYFNDYFNNSESITKYIDVGVGIGFRFNKSSKNLSYGFNFLFHHSSLELDTYPIRFEDDERSPIPSIALNYGLMPFRNENFSFILNGGIGFLPSGGYFFQTGISSLSGKKKHFLETGINFIFALLLNPNFEYKYSDYLLVQPQLGYRYQCQKIPVFARIAYAPYIRTLDWKREGGLHQNVVFGVGYRFGKK